MTRRSLRIGSHVAGSIRITDGNARPQRGQIRVSVYLAMRVLQTVPKRKAPAVDGQGRPVARGACFVRGGLPLVGLEARTHGESQHGKPTEGVHDLAKHERSSPSYSWTRVPSGA